VSFLAFSTVSLYAVGFAFYTTYFYTNIEAIFCRGGQLFVKSGQQIVEAGQLFFETGQQIVETGQLFVEAGQQIVGTMPIRNWGEALNQFAIIYGDRVPL
jgi:predicted methyltransferase